MQQVGLVGLRVGLAPEAKHTEPVGGATDIYKEAAWGDGCFFDGRLGRKDSLFLVLAWQADRRLLNLGAHRCLLSAKRQNKAKEHRHDQTHSFHDLIFKAPHIFVNETWFVGSARQFEVAERCLVQGVPDNGTQITG